MCDNSAPAVRIIQNLKKRRKNKFDIDLGQSHYGARDATLNCYTMSVQPKAPLLRCWSIGGQLQRRIK